MRFKFSEEQRAFITNLTDNILLQAVPGAGKTTTLLQKILYIFNKRPNSKIQYISFNTKLAIEFSEKLQQLLENQHKNKLLANVYINTFHSLLYKKYMDLFPNTILLLNENNSQNKLADGTKSTTLRYITFNDIEEYFVQNPSLIRHIFNKIDFLFIDEIQDMRPNLIKILLILFNTKIIINAVGDVYQTIYQFAGVETKYLTKLRTKFKTNLYLNTSYRLHKPITCLINKLFNQQIRPDEENKPSAQNRPQKNLANITLLPIKDYKEQSKVLKLMLQKWIIEQTDVAEIQLTAKHKLLPFSITGSTIAILQRANKQVVTLYNFLIKSNIPAVKLPNLLTSEVIFLNNLKAIAKEALKAKSAINNHLSQFLIQIKHHSGTRLPSSIIKDAKQTKTLNDMFLWIYKAQQYLSHLPYAGSINISTIHQAKGLEFDTVIIPNFETYNLEQLHNNIELKNLLYVALTRAKKELIILVRKDTAVYTILLQNLQDLKRTLPNNIIDKITVLESLQLELPKQQTLF